jgi:hypothetical protein
MGKPVGIAWVLNDQRIALDTTIPGKHEHANPLRNE